MDLSPGNLLFIKKDYFSVEKQEVHEKHHRKVSWVYYANMVLGLWLLAGPPTFGYRAPEMVWNDLIAGALLIILSYVALKPYNLWAQWSVIFLGILMFITPMIFWAKEGAAFLNNYMIATLVISFSIIVAKQPGIKLFAQEGPNVPPGWSYNPSSWKQRVPVIFLAWLGFFIARYMGAFQLGYIDSVWDPFFGDGTRQVLESKVSKSFPVSDATLGAFSYILDVLFGYAGNTHRWRTMPWVVIIFAILIIPLGIVSITLIILQPVSVGAWCTLCLCSATISLIMIPFSIDEALATWQLLKYEKKKRNRSYWNTFWLGGTMEGGSIEQPEDPKTLLPQTIKESARDILIKPWNLFLITAVGVWVMASPQVLGFSGSIANSSNIVGALIITFAVIAMSEVARPVRYINILFGLWLIAAPFIFSTEGDLPMWNGIIAGAVIIAVCFPKGKIEDKRGSFDEHIV